MLALSAIRQPARCSTGEPDESVASKALVINSMNVSAELFPWLTEETISPDKEHNRNKVYVSPLKLGLTSTGVTPFSATPYRLCTRLYR